MQARLSMVSENRQPFFCFFFLKILLSKKTIFSCMVNAILLQLNMNIDNLSKDQRTKIENFRPPTDG